MLPSVEHSVKHFAAPFRIFLAHAVFQIMWNPFLYYGLISDKEEISGSQTKRQYDFIHNLLNSTNLAIGTYQEIPVISPHKL